MRNTGRALLAGLGLVLALMSGEAQAARQSRPMVSVAYAQTDNPDLQPIAELLRDSEAFSDVAADIDATVRLPRRLLISFEECGVANAYYAPSATKITLCYELIAQDMAIFDDPDSTDEEVGDNIYNSTLFVLQHELGHALVDLLDLPVTGREEDAVDELATLILIDETGTEPSPALAAMIRFAAMADSLNESGLGVDELPYWGEHSLDAQRVYDIACLIYGSNPELYAGLVDAEALPESRAVRCPAEYERKSRAWGRLLSPHLKP